MKKKAITNIRLPAVVDIGDIYESVTSSDLTDEQIIEFIAGIDDSVCELGFSQKLVRRLMKPIRESLDKEEFSKFITSIGKTT